MSCPKCGQPLLEGTRLCWACGEEHVWAEHGCSLEVSALEPAREDDVARVLTALVDAPRPAVAFVVQASPFVVSSTSPAHLERLGHWLTALGVQFQTQGRVPEGPAWRFRFRASLGTAFKLGLSAAVGWAAIELGVPLLAWVASAIAAFTVWWAIELRPAALVIDALKGGDQLEPIGAAIAGELIASRRTLTDELTLAAVSRFLSEYVAVVGLVRSTGGHLAGDAKSLDELLVSLLRQVLLMAQRAQRTTRDEAIARTAAPDRVEKLLKNRSDVLRHVDRLTAGLAGARTQTLGVAPRQLTRTLGPPLTAVSVLVDKLRTEAQGW